MKVALVHDWLTNMGGAEKVLLALKEIYPDAPIYTSVYNPQNMPDIFRGFDIRTSWLQKIPLARRKHQLFPMLRAKAFEKFNFDEFDLVLSVTSSDAKGIIVNPEKTLHICYCNTPTRYYWSHYEEYKQNPGFGPLDIFIKPFIPLLVGRMRKWDLKAAARPAVYLANSRNVARRIKIYYNRDSTVLFPPVDVSRYSVNNGHRAGLLAAGRQIPYKRFDLAIEAANQLNMPLVVIGQGPEHKKLVKLGGPKVIFKTANDEELAAAFASAELFLFPNEEDAGLIPVEAMASGTPVVAFAKGGVLDVIEPGESGILFNQQNTESLIAAINNALKLSWDRQKIRRQAEKFSKPKFQAEIQKFVTAEYAKFAKNKL